MSSSERAYDSLHTDKTHTNTKAVMPIVIRISFPPSVVGFHFNQAFRCGILVGSILYQSVAFWYMPVRCPARLARRGVRNGPYWTPR
jgi:hypothetical protein